MSTTIYLKMWVRHDKLVQMARNETKAPAPGQALGPGHSVGSPGVALKRLT